MNCFEHPLQPAVAQCPDCGKGLCSGCASSYSLPICPACNKKRVRTEKSRIIKELFITFAVGILLAFLFVGAISAGHSYPLKHTVISYIVFTYIFCGIILGWKTLTSITPRIFLFMPIIGWVLYLIIKLLLSLCVGLVMFPVRTIRNISRLITLQKI